MAEITWGDYKDRIARLAHKNLNRTVQSEDVEKWGIAGIEAIEIAEGWNHLREPYTVTITEGDYRYAYPETNEFGDEAPLERIDELSIRYGTKPNHYLGYVTRPETIDRNERFGPGWRDAATPNGKPELVTEGRARELWVCRKPSDDWISDFGTIWLYGFTSDVHTILSTTTAIIDSTALRIPVWAAQCYVNAALMTGLQQEDDADWRVFRQYHRDDLQRLRSRPNAIAARREVKMPTSMRNRRRIL